MYKSIFMSPKNASENINDSSPAPEIEFEVLPFSQSLKPTDGE